jgi:hypothetical protein
MLSRALPLICLLLLAPAVSSRADATARESAEPAALDPLAALDEHWTALRQGLAAGRPGAPVLAAGLSRPLADALAGLQAAIGRGEVSPHRAGAGLAAVVRNSARSAGARAADLVELETALRETIPRLLAGPGPEASAAALPAVREPAPDRAQLRASYCAARPAPCEHLGAAELEAGLARELRSAQAPGLPEALALDLLARLVPAGTEALR